MLVLSRKPSEQIVLENSRTGELITVTTVRIGPGTVRLGVDAGNDWEIYRPETRDDQRD